ncbi:MAG: AAA family ATPase [Clostridia bacterium]|nr:AAA family ATPase [Clostridia bacterium]
MLQDELVELVKQVQSQGCERQTLEIKRAAQGCPKDIYETLSSFSNQNMGGIILFGLDESQSYAAVGVYDPQDLQRKVMEAGEQMEPVVRPILSVCELDGKAIVSAEITPLDLAERPCFRRSAGRLKGSYVRVGDGDLPMTEYEVYSFESFKKRARDELRAVDTDLQSLAMLDPDLVQEYLLRRKIARPRLANLSEAEQLSLASLRREDGSCTLWGLLVLGIDPQAAYPQLRISASQIPGTEIGEIDALGNRFLSTKAILGTLPEMLEDAVAYVQTNMRTGIGVDPSSGQRFEVPDYPIEAVREVILNALLHRDYSRYTESMPIQLQLYADRLEVRSPGGLFGRMSIDDLGKAQPETRNPALVVAMETLGKTENRYSGIPRVRRLMQDARLPKPVFQIRRGEFIAQLFNSRSAEAAVTDVQPLQEGPSDVSKGPRSTAEILDFCSEPRSRREIADFLGISSQGYAVRRYVTPLVEAGRLMQTIPEKPNSRLQRYQTVLSS